MKVGETSFIVTTLTGEIQSIDVSLQKLSIVYTDVRLDFSLPGCTLYGIAPSPNQAYFVLLSFVTQVSSLHF